MYGWLNGDTLHTSGQITAMIPIWEPLAAMDLTDVQRFVRRDRVMPFVRDFLAQDDPVTRERITAALRDIVLLAPVDSIDFAMNMCAAHERLPDGLRLAREATIARVVKDHFSETDQLHAQLTQLLDNTRKVAVLIPDALMELRLRTICGRIRHFLLKRVEMVTHEFAPVLHFVVELNDLCTPFRNTQLDNVSASLLDLLVTRPTAQLGAVQDQIRQLLKSGLGEVVSETVGRLAAMQKMHGVTGLDALARIIEDILANGRPAQWGDLIDPHLALAQALSDCQHNMALLASVAAVRVGVPMGAEYTRQSQAALQAMDDALQATDQKMTPARVRTTRQLRSKATPRPQAQAQAQAPEDVDTVQSWSVERLVRWIEGPVTDASVKRPIDRKKIVAQDRETRRQATPSRSDEPKAELSEADVGGMIEDALSATARFFLDDLRDLQKMATELGADPKALARCADLCGPLTQLAEQPSSMDEVKARNLLQMAETATAALRASVKEAKVTALVESRFAAQLSTALHAEPLVMGKRHGGVVLCAVRPGDWTFVAANFHRRWLTRATSIVVDGQPQPLASDQALALYVTASSKSQYAFDVSVHLWRRRPGSNSLPSGHSGLYPPMNTADWFDTYIPCAVLHVPLKS